MNPLDKTAGDQREGHRKRLRDKFLERGLAGFSDYEVVELLLTLGTPRRDCKPTAKAALRQLGSLSGVLEASPAELARVKGIGPANQFGIRLVKAVADRYLETRITDKPAVRNSKDLFDYLYGTMRGLKKERFTLIFLDTKNKIIKVHPISEGTVSESTVHPREVVAAALEHHAAALIFAHNHPSGDPSPSSDDMALTRRLVFACFVVDITVHEHIIIGGNRYFSFADQGLIAQMQKECDELIPRA